MFQRIIFYVIGSLALILTIDQTLLYSSYFTTFLLLIQGAIVTDDKQGHKLYTIDFVRSNDRCKDILMIYAGLIDHSCAKLCPQISCC